MARLLHDDGHHHDGGDRDRTGAEEAAREERRRRHDRRRRLIPVNNVTVDCTPVTFHTSGQAMNVVSQPVTQTVMVPVRQTQTIQVPAGFGCSLCVPVTQTVQMPVEVTVQMPPNLSPVPTVICPPNSPFCQAVQSCQMGGATTCPIC